MTMRKGIVLLSILVGAGAVAWAAQQAWRVFIVHQSDLNGPLVVQADGSVGAGASMVSVTSNDPNFTQAKADEQWAKMKQAIADGKFKLRETRETNGTLVYLYDITLPDGKVVGFGSNRPMEEIQTEEQSESPDE